MATTTNPNGQTQDGATIIPTQAPTPAVVPTFSAGDHAVITPPNINSSTPIDASALSGGTTPFTLPPAPTDPTPQLQSTLGSIPTIASIVGQEDTLTPAEQTNKDLAAQGLALSGQEAGKSQAQTAANNAQGLPALNAQLTDLNSQIKALQNQANVIPLQAQQDAQARGITAGGLQPIETGQLRQNTIKALGLSSLASALQGNIATAQAQADAAVKAQFDPIEAEISYIQSAIAANKDQMTKEEKTQADTVTAQLNERTTQIANARTDMSTAQGWAAAAVKNNPGNQAAQLAAQQALAIDYTQPGALQKALTLLGPYQQDPTATAKAVADLEQTRAQTGLTKAETAKNYADAKSASATASAATLAPYLNQSGSGTAYVDLSAVSAAEKSKLAASAAAAGVKVIFSTNEAADLKNIQNAYSNLDTISSTLKGLTAPGATARALYSTGLSGVSTFFQTDAQKSATGALNDAALDLLKSISGVQGFRGNQAAIEQIKNSLPTIYDTSDTAAQKIANVRQLIANRESALLGQKADTSANTSGTTIMTGPDGKQYNVPNNKVADFKAAGGH